MLYSKNLSKKLRYLPLITTTLYAKSLSWKIAKFISPDLMD